jgi:Phosphodiester glycosidase/Glycosyl transferases group 1
MEKQAIKTLNAATMLEELKREQINTWFDLGLFIDRIREKKPSVEFPGELEDFKHQIEKGGVGLISFFFTIDGITVEANKYTSVLKSIFPETKVHYIAGEIHPEASELIDSPYQKEIKEMDGFDNWPLYNKFFKEELERGNQTYNELIGEFWNEVLVIVEKLGKYIEENNINLLYIINVCSNPGNVSLALAVVLLSEYLAIPVINNSHDFYWEGGNRKIDIETKGLKKGPRDFFFTNAHVGEFFSIMEVLFPWERKSWMTVNINRVQYNRTIRVNGHNPANVTQIGTAIDYKSHLNVSKRSIIRAFMQVASIFENNKDYIMVHSVEKHIKSERSLHPILLGHSKIYDFDFVNNNIVFLQPTRVISRKSIELNFRLITNLLQEKSFRQKFVDNPKLKITLLVSGPIPHGQRDYYSHLLSDFKLLMESIPEQFKSKVFLGFLFSEFDKDDFRQKYKAPIDIWHLYHIASLILLPSQTEGRGLPILEAAASGTPIFCRQYDPRAVYEEVIGYHLNEKNRLKVLEFKGSKLPKTLINKIIDHVFYPQIIIDEVNHNLNVIKNRYSYKALEADMSNIITKLYDQLHSVSKNNISDDIGVMLKRYKSSINVGNKDLDAIINQKTRHYLPGYGRLSFMIYLKSLIDPSFFRVEEQLIKGRVFNYATMIQNGLKEHSNASETQIARFFNLVAEVFNYQTEEYTIRHDHAIAYRHRNRKRYAYMDYTYQELIGLVNMIHHEVFKPERLSKLSISPQFFTDWELALFQLTNSESLEIDNRQRLTKMLKQNVPKGYFPGKYIKHEMEFFILQPFRAQLNLSIEEELTEELLIKKKDVLEHIYIFVHEPHKDTWFSNTYITEYIESEKEPELSLLYKHGLVEIIKTQQWCNGVHFQQIGTEALAVLRKIKEKNGFFVSNGEHAAMMSDTINIDHFHIGKARDLLTANIMGISQNSGFIQFVPAGLRTTLAYPTPIQTAKDFDIAIKSPLFHRLAEKYGEVELYKIMGEDAEKNGTPVVKLMESIEKQDKNAKQSSKEQYQFVGGVYSDGLPWSGVIAEADTKTSKWNFKAHIAKEKPKNVPALLQEYAKENKTKNKIDLAWNGGYILNPELVGKLGLPEQYIGSPLGLLVLDGKVKCPPLFNKPSFVIYKDGSIDILKINAKNGFVIKQGKTQITFNASAHNVHKDKEASFYDLNNDLESIQGNGHVIVRLAGNTVKEIIKTTASQDVKIIPVGLTLSIPKKIFDAEVFKVGEELVISMIENKTDNVKWSNISYAIEAGPMLLENGECVINMESEGWKTQHSINTQAARLDFTDMRGPKIAVGIDEKGNLKVLAVNGRIRESVGATHDDMALILKDQGMKKAMGFDPGGSSTLFVDGEIVNISPYNKDYEEDIYSLPPEPRFVSNIVFGWKDDAK